MTTDEILDAAFARVADLTDAYPTTKSVSRARVNTRHAEVFGWAAQWNPEYFGVCAVGTVQDGAVNLAALEEAGLYPIGRLDEVRVADAGGSDLRVGQRIHVVRITDAHAFRPPRATLRSDVLRGVDGDLGGVATVRIYYSRRPRRLAPDDEIEIPEPFGQLLVLDLARDLCRRTYSLEGERRAAFVKEVDREEQELRAAFEAHVTGYAATPGAP